MKTFIFLIIAVSCVAKVNAQNLVAYYQIGGERVPWVSWDTYVVDSDSIVQDGAFIKYKSFRISATGSDEHQWIRTDCLTMKRGRLEETSMYSTYDGTLSGQEVKAACKLALEKQVIKK